MRALTGGLAALLTTLAVAAPAFAQLPQLPDLPDLPGDAETFVEPYGTNDGGGFRNILPPGANGFASAADVGAFLAACPPGGTTNCPNAPRPKHSSKELQMYGDLVYAAPGPERRRPRQVLQGRRLRRAPAARSSAPTRRAAT